VLYIQAAALIVQCYELEPIQLEIKAENVFVDRNGEQGTLSIEQIRLGGLEDAA
jgi:hypothetical protein